MASEPGVRGQSTVHGATRRDITLLVRGSPHPNPCPCTCARTLRNRQEDRGGITWLSSSSKLFLSGRRGRKTYQSEQDVAESHFILIFGDVYLICTPELEVKQNLLFTDLLNWLMWNSLKKKKKSN